MARGESEIGEAREPGLEAVHNVVAARAEGESHVRSNGDRDAHVRTPGDRHRGADRDHVHVFGSLEGAAPGEEVAGSRRGREDGHRVAEASQRVRSSRDVDIDLVRL